MNKNIFSVNYSDHLSNRTNFQLLIWMRVISIVGQVTAVFVADNVLGISLRTEVLYTWIAIYILINVLAVARLFSDYEIYNWEFLLHLLIDIFILTILLKYSEGGANPFVSLYLIPLTISAITLPAVFTWTLAAVTVGCYSLLVWIISPMSEHSFHAHNFEIHVLGMWLGFVISAVLIAFFVVRMGRTIRLQHKQLVEQRTEALQNEQLVKLGTLAASTAHELGTPLGTMQLLVEDLQDKTHLSSKDKELHLLKDQIARCKEALSILSASVGTAPLEYGEPMQVKNFIEEILQDWQKLRPNITLKTDWQEECLGPKIIAERSLKQAIKNVLDNAANASPDYVLCESFLNSRELVLKISDRGPGISFDENENIGHQPYPNSKSKGLGLGLFLSHGIIKRFGGNVSLKNNIEGGLQTTILLPIDALSVS